MFQFNEDQLQAASSARTAPVIPEHFGRSPVAIASTAVVLRRKDSVEPGPPARIAARAPTQEQLMKLNATQVKQTLTQMDAHVLPDNHPVVTQLTSMFGDHTFFLDDRGLNVLEPAEAPEQGTETGEVLNLADWTDASLTSLTPHEPESTGTIVVFREIIH
jgi:hypothetical protein